MSTFAYPAVLKLERGGQGFVVSFPDLPEALTGGSDLADALAQAADCLGEALAGRMVRGEAIPRSSKLKSGQHRVEVPLYLAPKLALYTILRERGISKSELARRLGCRETVVRRMLDPKHDTKPEKLAAALEALGKRLLVSMEEAA